MTEQAHQYWDYTESLKSWLMQEHGLNEDTAVVSIGGIMIGLSLWDRHPEYARTMLNLTQMDMMVRAGGSVTAFGLMAHGLGDDRTAPQQMADDVAHEVLLG